MTGTGRQTDIASFLNLGAAELARRIGDGALRSFDVVRGVVDRIAELDPHLGAVTVRRFEQALDEAQAVDQRSERDGVVQPFLGVPITVKDCFDVEGLPSSLGLTGRQPAVARGDAEAVRRLKRAGAIVVAKTNLSQLMLFHETDNPRFGCTRNPWNLERSCGGSGGGDAALVAARGSPLGLGTDQGGSVRVPAHCCGIHGLIPTPGSASEVGMRTAFADSAHIACVPGFLARRVEDLGIALSAVANRPPLPSADRVERRRPAGLDNVRIAVWDQADYFAPSPAIRRAVTEAALVLREAGSTIVSVPPPPLGELVDLFLGIGTADGGEMFRQLLRGSDIDPRVASILHSAQMPAALRALRVSWLVRSGQRFSAEMLRATGRRSVAEYWRLCRRLGDLRQACFSAWDKAGLDAAILPAYGLPAIPHGDSVNLLCAAGYALAANALGLPAGSVAVTRVRADECSVRGADPDRVVQLAARAELGSAGLPIGVQVVARPWCESTLLAIMTALERGFETHDDYPLQTVPL